MSMFTIAGAPTIEEGDMELIYSELLTSQQNSFDTGTLKTGFRGLLIHARLRGDANNNASAMSIFFNGDETIANYQTSRAIYHNSPVVGQAYDTTLAGGVVMSASTQPRFATVEIHIIGHELNTGYKSWISNHQSISQPSGFQHYHGGPYSGVWENTDPITSIKYRVFDPQFNLVTGSSFAVYGLK